MNAKGHQPAASRHLLGIAGLSKSSIEAFLERGSRFADALGKRGKISQSLSGRTLINLFFEPSTRTRISFEIAARKLGMDAVNFASGSSSLKKGETVADTVRTLAAMGADALVIRIGEENVIEGLAAATPCPVVNAGDGAGEHPTQALLDALTLVRRKGAIEGLKVAIIGDIAHSRVARSNFHLLPKLGAEVAAFGPQQLMPQTLPEGIARASSMREAVDGADAVMMLRVQRERMAGEEMAAAAYFKEYGLNAERLVLAKPDAIVMHPGPVNRGIEIADEVADDPERSAILDQVANGVAVRMAVLELVVGGA